MPVNYVTPPRDRLHAIAGVRLGATEAGIKKANRTDLLLIALDPGAHVAAVFTQNRFCAAPVSLAKTHLARGAGIRALLVNTGNANAGTGTAGLADALATCETVAAALGCTPEQVLPFSTGVIMEPLPVAKIQAAVPACVARLGQTDWLDAAHAIMTTDTVPKASSRQLHLDGKTVTVTGIAKGSGMIHPNMATMLGFIATDAALAPALLQSVLEHAVGQSFNCITVDGDTSTNDACVLMATGASGVEVKAEGPAFLALRDAITAVAVELAQAIVRDGEGATKFMTIRVENGRDVAECRRIGYAIAHSPLVKTAFFASDPNLGRILAAIGYAGVADLDVARLKLYLGDVLVAEDGGRAKTYREEDGARVMKQAEILVRVVLDRGSAAATVWTCDFSYDYVKINAEYRS